jgi:hypothetical protein
MRARFPYLCQLDAQGRASFDDAIDVLVTRSMSRRADRERARVALQVELGDITSDERDAL